MKAKGIIATLVALSLLLVTVPALAAPDGPSSWAVAQVNEAIEARLVPSDLRSDYAQPATRAEFCALAVALYEALRGEITARATFADTTDANVQKAAAIGIVAGVGDNLFAPDEDLTREQAAVMLSNLAGVLGAPFPQRPPDFADKAAISAWAVESVGQAQAAGVMGGVGDNLFAPKGSYTREQSVVTIKRVYDLATGAASLPPASVPPPALNSLPVSDSLRKGMTEAEFQEAYDIAYNLMSGCAGYDQEEKIMAAYLECATIRHSSEWIYSMEDKHYNDVYGFFVLGRTSCAGDVRAAGLCLTILGIPYEHVNENSYGHQWVRVELDGQYVVLDVNAPYIGYELEPYKHPLIG